MEWKDESKDYKSVQRAWKDVNSRFLRRCKVPKQMIVVAIIIIGIIGYTLFSKEALRVSDDLIRLQSVANVKEAFESVKISLDENMVDLDIPRNGTVADQSEVHEKIDLWAKTKSKKHTNLREQRKEMAVMPNPFSRTQVNNDIKIVGSLSQIIPSRVEQSSLPPKVIMRYEMQYPPFVIPPPFPYETSKRNTLQMISKFYQELASHKQEDCDSEDICVHPSHYVHLYTQWNCSERLCGADKDYIVFFQEPYRRGVMEVVQDGVLPLAYDCNDPMNYELTDVDATSAYTIDGKVVYLNSKDGGSFYNFVRYILPKLVQLESVLLDTSVRLLVDLSPQSTVVIDLFRRLGVEESRLINARSLAQTYRYIQAKQLILSSRTPPIHPYLMQRAQYLLQLPFIQTPAQYDKKTILYLSRKKGTLNSARRVVNEPEVVAHLKNYASTNGLEFKVFFHTDYADTTSLLELLATVHIIVGPHGGAFNNIVFAPRGIKVIELLPNGSIFTGTTFKDHLFVYQLAMVMGDRYYSVMCPFSKRDDITVNVKELLSILSPTVV